MPKGPEPSSDDHRLAKTRYILGRILQQRAKDYEEAKKTITDREKLKERLKEIFQYPEKIPEVAALLEHLSTDQMPRKFRETKTNSLGFKNESIVDYASFEKLEVYNDALFLGNSKRVIIII